MLAPTRYFVSLGYGIGSAYCTQFLRGGLYYDQMMAAPLALKGKVTFGAIVIMLGITERHSTAIGTYPECINQLVTAIRTDLAEPNMPLLLTDYEMGSTGQDLPTGPSRNKLILRFAGSRRVSNSVGPRRDRAHDHPFIFRTRRAEAFAKRASDADQGRISDGSQVGESILSR